MATTTTKGRTDNQSLTRSRSLGRKPKPGAGSSEHNGSSDGSDHKPEKPLPNYLKPTISSRPEPAKHLRKGHHTHIALDDSQKLLRRRSFDRPPSSLSSPSTSSPRLQKSLNISPARPRDKPSVPRDKPVPGQRSSSLHATKTGPRGGGSVKSPALAPKKSGLSTTSPSLHSKKEGSSANVSKKSLDKEIIRESSPPPAAHEEEQEIVKVVGKVEVSDDRDELQSQDKEGQAEVVQSNQSGDEKDIDQSDASSPVLDCPDVTKEEEEEEEEVISEDKTLEQIEETKAPEDNLDDKGEEEEVKKKVEEESGDDAVVTDVKETTSVEESTEEEKKGDEEQDNGNEGSGAKEETSEPKAVAESPEGTKRQVVQGKKESPSAYNDVIEKTASKLLENRKNKVKALVGAFETVIDYETAASK